MKNKSANVRDNEIEGHMAQILLSRPRKNVAYRILELLRHFTLHAYSRNCDEHAVGFTPPEQQEATVPKDMSAHPSLTLRAKILLPPSTDRKKWMPSARSER